MRVLINTVYGIRLLCICGGECITNKSYIAMSCGKEELLTSAEDIRVRRKISVVWNYFEKLNRWRVRCNLCKHEQNYQGTTGNILRHLKKKHNIDATVSGQQGKPTESLRRILDVDEMDDDKEYCNNDEEFDIVVKTEDDDDKVAKVRQQPRDAKNKVVSYCEDLDDVDPYAGSSGFDDYIVTNTKSSPIKDVEDEKKSFQKRKVYSAQEERLMAEIEYFREKAAYYRMQKNLTALQAKKVKYELDQLC